MLLSINRRRLSSVMISLFLGTAKKQVTLSILGKLFLEDKGRAFVCFQVPVRAVAGERRGRWQLGESSDRTSGVTWWRGGCWPVDRNASRAGLSFPECPDRAGITWPKQYVPSHGAFFSTIADLLVYAVCVLQTHTGLLVCAMPWLCQHSFLGLCF